MADPLGLVNPSGAGPMRPVSLLPSAAPKGPGEVPAATFKDVLMNNIEQVNKLQEDAQVAIEDLAVGRRDLADVMMATKKAELAFHMLLQVRNKLVDAYEEIRQIRV